MYSKNNTAKEYILRKIAEIINGNKTASILDFACGTCLIWKKFFEEYGDINFYGFDFNPQSIEIAKNTFPNMKDNIFVLDGQKNLPFDKKFDVITTFSSLEHVRNKYEFIKNIKQLLKKDGLAYINYDHGHFEKALSTDIYNAISRLLADVGITEKFYTKKVDLSEIKKILETLNLEIIDIKFFNIDKLKNIHKKIKFPEALEKWYDYELLLNNNTDKNFLDRNFSSVVFEIKKNE